MDQLELAERYITSTNISVFLTGKAGTGKTTFLHHIFSTVKKRCVVLAPTGVAAVNAGGVTIHSFFSLPLCPYLPDVKELVTEYQMPNKFKTLRKEKLKVIRTLELVIIDEISMVRADLLDAVDMSLRRYRHNNRPFGGVQLLLIGDVHQLPPVVTDDEKPYIEKVYPSPYFFNSKALQKTPYVTIELKHIFRQQDDTFISLLNKIRDNCFDKSVIDTLNSRYIPSFKTPDNEKYIRLTTHNYQSNNVNQRKLNELPSKPFELKATVDGTFPETSYPTESVLTLKKGAQVMFVKNDSGHAYYNGKIANVEGYDPEHGVAVVDDEGNHIVVKPERWENIKYEIDEKDNQIKKVVDGTFTQYPLRLAWAITIHKSQGLTFDRVVIDAASAFTYGQVYVALSRCRTLEGIVLVTPLSSNCVFDNEDILRFNSNIPPQEKVEGDLHAMQSAYFFDLLGELFDMTPITRPLERINRIFQDHLRRMLPAESVKMSQLTSGSMVDIVSVSEKFRKQLNNIRMATEGDTGDARLQERIVKGSAWFDSQLEQLQLSLAPLLEVNIGNKVVASDFDEHSDELRNAVELKRLCFKRVGEKGFSTETFNKAKVDFFLDKESGKPSASKKSYLNRRNQPKPKKQPTWVESLQLFLEGKTFKEIASARNLTVHTIENHIVKAIEEGKLNIDKIMSNEEVTEINSYVSSENPLSLTQIFEHFENKYPYYKIRAALVFQQS